MRAYRTEACSISSIVFAESASKARYATYLAATDAGFPAKIPAITVRRAPEFDIRKTLRGDIPTSGMCHIPENLATLERSSNG